MRKILPILIATVVYLAPLYPVYAQVSDTQTLITPQPSVKKIVKPSKLTFVPDKSNSKLQIATTPGNLKEVMVAPPAAANMANVRDKMASRAAELKLKLEKFRDKAKATRVENINSNLNSINQRRTSEMQQSLSQIAAVVSKLKSWVSTQEAAGKDMTSLKSVISNVENLWSEADSALKVQAENDYTIQVNSETTVKADAQKARDSLRSDLKSIHDKLISVRQSLVEGLTNLKGNL